MNATGISKPLGLARGQNSSKKVKQWPVWGLALESFFEQSRIVFAVYFTFSNLDISQVLQRDEMHFMFKHALASFMA